MPRPSQRRCEGVGHKPQSCSTATTKPTWRWSEEREEHGETWLWQLSKRKAFVSEDHLPPTSQANTTDLALRLCPTLARPSLATTCFGHDLLWPRPGRLWPQPGGLWPQPFNLANLGRFWSGKSDFGQFCPPTLAIWEMAWPIFGGQADSGLRTPLLPASDRPPSDRPPPDRPPPDRPPPDRPKFRVFFFLLPPPIFILLFSLRVSSRVFCPLSGGLLVEFWS